MRAAEERLQEAASTGQLVPVTSPAVGPAAATPSEGRLTSAATTLAASGAAIAPAGSGAAIALAGSGAAIAPAASGAAIPPAASGAAIAPSTFSPIGDGSSAAVATPAASCLAQNSLSCGSVGTAAAALADGTTLATPADGTAAAMPAAGAAGVTSAAASSAGQLTRRRVVPPTRYEDEHCLSLRQQATGKRMAFCSACPAMRTCGLGIEGIPSLRCLPNLPAITPCLSLTQR